MTKYSRIRRLSNIWRTMMFWYDWNSLHYDPRYAKKAEKILNAWNYND